MTDKIKVADGRVLGSLLLAIVFVCNASELPEGPPDATGAATTSPVCKAAAERAERLRALIPSSQSGRVGIGKRRIQFYTAPDRHCLEKGVFILPGQTVDAALEYGEFTYVDYLNLKSGDSTSGWVLTSRLRETGTGIGPN